MDASVPPSSQVWRVQVGARAAAVFLVVGWLAMTVGVAVRGASDLHIAVESACGVAIAIGCKRRAFAPYLELTPEAIVIQNRVHRVRLPYDEVSDVTAGYQGLAVRRRNSPAPVVAWAVQKSNVSKWRHQRSVADDVAEAIRLRLPAYPAADTAAAPTAAAAPAAFSASESAADAIPFAAPGPRSWIP